MYSKTKAKALILLLVFSFFLASLPEIGTSKEENNRIYIRADGKVAGTDKIKREGDFYTFTGDIGTENWSYGITIQRDNIVVDGAGYILKGHGQTSMMDIFAFGKPIINGIKIDGCNNITIKNLQFWGFNCGFRVKDSTNIRILGNNLTKIATSMILEYVSNSVIQGNSIICNGTDGISYYKGENNTISDNYIKDNFDGISLKQFCNGTISGNIITKSDSTGIALTFSSSNNVIFGNIVSNNSNGITIAGFNNTVSGNEITDHSHSGISIVSLSSNNTITENSITYNNKGVSIREAPNNTFCKNNFINNSVQIFDMALEYPDHYFLSMNLWNNSIAGNYWSDYKGTDRNGDDLGDTPYTVYENNTDCYPLMHPVFLEIVLPSISIISPQNVTYSTDKVSLNFTVNKEISWMGYSLDEQNNLTITETTLNFTELSDGTHSLTVYATDTRGNTGKSETINFTIETASTTQVTIAIVIIALIGAAFLVYFLYTKKTTKPK
jgi:parallel beta-helix repeat protein